MLLSLLSLSLPACAALRSWPVVLQSGQRRSTLMVREDQSVLTAAEAAGLLPGSDCRRGKCLSCAARVCSGNAFSLRVSDETALCDEAHADGLVLLCSAYPTGPGLELELDNEGDAWDYQYRRRFERTPEPLPRKPPPPAVHFRKSDAAEHLDRCRLQELEVQQEGTEQRPASDADS